MDVKSVDGQCQNRLLAHVAHIQMMATGMNEPPGARFRVAHVALTMAEYFRDDEHRDVLLLIDNIFRFIQAGSEESGLMGQMPSRPGYQPTTGMEQLGQSERKLVNRARRLERFFTQPFFTTGQFNDIPGKQISLADALDGCERILKDEFHDCPESALSMIGAVDEADVKSRALQQADSLQKDPKSTNKTKTGATDGLGIDAA